MSDVKPGGTGIFSWDGHERRSSRYGSFGVYPANYEQTVKVIPYFNLEALKELEGKRVKVTVTVLCDYESGHIGDLFLKTFPSRPKVGEVVDLGVGTFNLIETEFGPNFQLTPNDGREEFWMDPKKLYRLHDQVVSVSFEVTEEDFSPPPSICFEKQSEDTVVPVPNEGAIQVKSKLTGPCVITPKITRLGDGLFIMDPLGEVRERS